MIVKFHKVRDGKKIIAICDEDLFGKKFEDKKLQLDLSSDFYKGKKMPEEDIIKFLSGAYIINLVGEKSINLGLKQGLIDKGNIIYVKKIPHAQAVLS